MSNIDFWTNKSIHKVHKLILGRFWEPKINSGAQKKKRISIGENRFLKEQIEIFGAKTDFGDINIILGAKN